LATADRELDRAWDLSGKKLNTVFLQRARIFEERGDNKGAVRELENYLKAEPNAKDALVIKEAISNLRTRKKRKDTKIEKRTVSDQSGQGKRSDLTIVDCLDPSTSLSI